MNKKGLICTLAFQAMAQCARTACFLAIATLRNCNLHLFHKGSRMQWSINSQHRCTNFELHTSVVDTIFARASLSTITLVISRNCIDLHWPAWNYLSVLMHSMIQQSSKLSRMLNHGITLLLFHCQRWMGASIAAC